MKKRGVQMTIDPLYVLGTACVALLMFWLWMLWSTWRHPNLVQRYNRGIASPSDEARVRDMLEQGSLEKNGYVDSKGTRLPQVRISSESIRVMIK